VGVGRGGRRLTTSAARGAGGDAADPGAGSRDGPQDAPADALPVSTAPDAGLAYPPPVGAPMAPPPRPARWWLGVTGGAVAAVLLVGLVVVAGDGGGRGVLRPPGSSPSGSGDEQASRAFTEAGAALVTAGSFSYRATSRAEGPAPWGNGETSVVEDDLAGDVVLPDAVRERVDGSDGLSVEQISIGAIGGGGVARAWQRSSAYADQLASRPWTEADPGAAGARPQRVDLAQLPSWLAQAVGHRAAGEDEAGDAVVSATVPPRLVDALGPDVTLIEAEIELTVGDDGSPRRVALTLAATDTVVEATYDITAVGGQVAVAPPPPSDLDATPWFNEQDVAAFEGPAPLGLSRVPEGWGLAGAYVTPDPEGGSCPSVSLDYADLDAPDGAYLWIDVMGAGCADPPAGEAVTAGALAGAVADQTDGGRWGVVSSSDVDVWFATDLSATDVAIVLGSLAPLDVSAVPEPLPGIPSSGT